MSGIILLRLGFRPARRRQGACFPAIVAGFLGVAPAAPVGAIQPEVQLKVDSVAGWNIEASEDVVFSGDWIDDTSDVQRLEDTRIVFVSAQQADGFFLVSTDGTEWQKIGRAGDGPGEYRYIRWVVPQGDQLHVFDAAGMRRTVLDASFQVVHTNPIMILLKGSAVVLRDSTYVVNGSVPSSERVGYVLHHIDAAGDVITSFDEPPEGDRAPGSDNASYRVLVAAADGALYSARRSQYRIDSWDVSTGELVRSWVRDAEWFAPHNSPVSRDPGRPAQPTIIDMDEDADGRLWLLISVASERWADGFVATGAGAHPELGGFVLDDWNVAYDTVVEVIDPATGCVLASQTVDELMPYFVGPGWALSSREDARGNPVRQLWRLRLQRSVDQSGEEPCS